MSTPDETRCTVGDPDRVVIELLRVTARLGAFRSVLAGAVAVAGRLHLLTTRAVLDLATLGCALACCGALMLTPQLVLRGRGTACGGCLAAGSA